MATRVADWESIVAKTLTIGGGEGMPALGKADNGPILERRPEVTLLLERRGLPSFY